MYIGLKENAARLLSSTNPKVKVKFPHRKEYAINGKSKRSNNEVAETENGWLSKKKKTPKTKKKTSKSQKQDRVLRRSHSNTSDNANSQPEVIDMLDDSDDEPILRKRPSRLSANSALKKIRKEVIGNQLYNSDSTIENEF